MHFGGNSFSQSQAFAAANAISHPISDIDRRLASGCPQREISQIDHTCWTNSSGRLLINTSNGAVPPRSCPSSFLLLYVCIVYMYTPLYSSNRHIIVMHIQWRTRTAVPYVRPYIYMHIYTYIRKYITRIFTYIFTRMYIRTYVHMYVCVYVYTCVSCSCIYYICIYIYILYVVCVHALCHLYDVRNTICRIHVCAHVTYARVSACVYI